MTTKLSNFITTSFERYCKVSAVVTRKLDRLREIKTKSLYHICPGKNSWVILTQKACVLKISTCIVLSILKTNQSYFKDYFTCKKCIVLTLPHISSCKREENKTCIRFVLKGFIHIRGQILRYTSVTQNSCNWPVNLGLWLLCVSRTAQNSQRVPVNLALYLFERTAPNEKGLSETCLWL